MDQVKLKRLLKELWMGYRMQ